MCTEKKTLTWHCIQFKCNITHTDIVVILLQQKGENGGFFPIIAWKK